jgi:hypothetical protein
VVATGLQLGFIFPFSENKPRENYWSWGLFFEKGKINPQNSAWTCGLFSENQKIAHKLLLS